MLAKVVNLRDSKRGVENLCNSGFACKYFEDQLAPGDTRLGLSPRKKKFNPSSNPNNPSLKLVESGVNPTQEP